MKFDWLKEPRKAVPCDIVHNGEKRTLMLHPLTDMDVDAASRAFPVLDSDEPEAKAAKEENRALYLCAVAIGAEYFESADILEQIKELPQSAGGFSKASLALIMAAAIGHYTLTPAMLEAAKTSIRPTESGA